MRATQARGTEARGTEVRRTAAVVPAALVLAFVLALSGCGNEDTTSGSSSGSGSGRMDMQAAAERSDAMLDAVLKAVDPDLQWAHGPTTTRPVA